MIILKADEVCDSVRRYNNRISFLFYYLKRPMLISSYLSTTFDIFKAYLFALCLRSFPICRDLHIGELRMKPHQCSIGPKRSFLLLDQKRSHSLYSTWLSSFLYFYRKSFTVFHLVMSPTHFVLVCSLLCSFVSSLP